MRTLTLLFPLLLSTTALSLGCGGTTDAEEASEDAIGSFTYQKLGWDVTPDQLLAVYSETITPAIANARGHNPATKEATPTTIVRFAGRDTPLAEALAWYFKDHKANVPVTTLTTVLLDAVKTGLGKLVDAKGFVPDEELKEVTTKVPPYIRYSLEETRYRAALALIKSTPSFDAAGYLAKAHEDALEFYSPLKVTRKPTVGQLAKALDVSYTKVLTGKQAQKEIVKAFEADVFLYPYLHELTKPNSGVREWYFYEEVAGDTVTSSALFLDPNQQVWGFRTQWEFDY